MKKLRDYSLPSWMYYVLPEPNPHSLNRETDGRCWFEDDKGKVYSEHSSREDAYESTPEDVEIPTEHMFWIKGSRGSSYFWGSHNDSQRLLILEDSYEMYLEARKSYLSYPDSMGNVYAYLDNHPAFWIKDDEPFDWKCDNRVSNFWLMYYGGVWLEAGASIAPEYKQHYHDTRLDVFGDTWEEALKTLAGRVHKHFDIDGNDRGLDEDY